MNEVSKTVVILGRVNVGKSALFNCLTNSNEAVISPLPGTTCDRKYGLVEQKDKLFTLVDTGAVDLMSLKDSIFALSPKRTKIEISSTYKGPLEQAMLRQTKTALKEADLLLVLVDGQRPLGLEDKDLALVLKKINIPKMLVCNKIDRAQQVSRMKEFRRLRLGEPIAVSAKTARNKGNLLDFIIEALGIELTLPPATFQEASSFRIVIIGRSNTGKSSLFNQILGRELAVASDVYQTTVDSHSGSFNHQGKSILLTDTFGLLEESDMRTDIEKVATQKTLEILEKSDAVLFMTEVTKSLCSTDQYLASLVKKVKKRTVIIANKWDAFPRQDKEIIDQIVIHYRNYLPALASSPIIFTSAKTGEGVQRVLDIVTSSLESKRPKASAASLMRASNEMR